MSNTVSSLAKKWLHQDDIKTSFYLDHLLPYATRIYHMAYMLCLNDKLAKELVNDIYEEFVERLEVLVDQHLASRVLVELVFEHFHKDPEHSKIPVDASALSGMLKGLTLSQRAAFLAVDFLGLTCGESATLLKTSETDLRTALAHAREKFVNS